jgi:hypothetical protein
MPPQVVRRTGISGFQSAKLLQTSKNAGEVKISATNEAHLRTPANLSGKKWTALKISHRARLVDSVLCSRNFLNEGVAL